MRRMLAVLSMLFFGVTLTAHATAALYQVTGTLAEGGTFSGTFTVQIGQYSSPIVALDVTVSGPGAGVFDSGAPGSSYGYSPSYAQVEFSNLLLFYLRVDPANGYALCTVAVTCGGDYTREVDSALPVYQNAVETAVVQQVTPEPSSLVLLGTGLLGAAGVARRRFLQA